MIECLIGGLLGRGNLIDFFIKRNVSRNVMPELQRMAWERTCPGGQEHGGESKTARKVMEGWNLEDLPGRRKPVRGPLPSSPPFYVKAIPTRSRLQVKQHSPVLVPFLFRIRPLFPSLCRHGNLARRARPVALLRIRRRAPPLSLFRGVQRRLLKRVFL